MAALDVLEAVHTALVAETRQQARHDAYVARWRAGRQRQLRDGTL